MNQKRDIIQEIQDIRQRRKRDAAMSELCRIEQSFFAYGRVNAELCRYFPVAIIACLESYCRIIVQEMIDMGDPYLKNAEDLPTKIKIGFPHLHAVHGRKITVGELIAHTLQLSSLEKVDAIFSTLLGTRFLEKLSTTTERWERELRGLDVLLLANAQATFQYVNRTFQLRHIICHEFASAYEVDMDEIELCLKNCILFLRTTEECINEILHPNAPLTQAEMNMVASDELGEAKDRLEALYERVKSVAVDPNRYASFDDVQTKWQSYCDAWANFVAEDYLGGSIMPLIHCSEASARTTDRVEELEQYLTYYLETCEPKNPS